MTFSSKSANIELVNKASGSLEVIVKFFLIGISIVTVVLVSCGGSGSNRKVEVTIEALTATPTTVPPTPTMEATATMVETVEPTVTKEPEVQPTPISDNTTAISLEEALNLIRTCQVRQVVRLHSGHVDITLTDGTKRSTEQQKTDVVFPAAVSAEATCGPIERITE